MNLKYICYCLSFLFPAVIWANGKVIGNGGNTVVCKNATGKTIRAEIFDLYEGRALKGLFYQEKSASPLAQAIDLANKISEATGSSQSEENFASDIKDTFNSFKLLPSNVGLKSIDDGAEVILPKNCEKVQTANRQDSKIILIDSDIWKILSKTQKAALILHETIYRHLQRSKVHGNTVEVDSARTRRLVAHLVSGGALEPIDSSRKNAIGKILSCTTNKEDADVPTTYFTIYQETQNTITAEFQQWLSLNTLTRTTLKNYLAINNSWPPAQGKDVVISGNLVSPAEDQIKAVVKFTSALAGEIWFDQRGVRTIAENFECFERE